MRGHPFVIGENIEIKVKKDTRFYKTTLKALAPALKSVFSIPGSDKLPEPSSITILLSYNNGASRPGEGIKR